MDSRFLRFSDARDFYERFCRAVSCHVVSVSTTREYYEILAGELKSSNSHGRMNGEDDRSPCLGNDILGWDISGFHSFLCNSFMEQISALLEKSKDTPIHMQVLFNVLMGLRRSEINGVKYSDVDYINRTLKVERQLGRIHNAVKEDFAPKTFTKQEVGLKTKSSYREIPIPDYVSRAILKERQVYERNKNRRKREFQDLGYICCSTLGRARSKGFHCRYYKQLLAENGLPDIRWHDLRSTYCTLLLKEAFNPKGGIKTYGTCKRTHNNGCLC